MLTSANISACRSTGAYITVDQVPVSISYTLDSDGNATLNAADLADFFARDDVSFSREERAEVQSYLESVAEGND